MDRLKCIEIIGEITEIHSTREPIRNANSRTSTKRTSKNKTVREWENTWPVYVCVCAPGPPLICMYRTTHTKQRSKTNPYLEKWLHFVKLVIEVITSFSSSFFFYSHIIHCVCVPRAYYFSFPLPFLASIFFHFFSLSLGCNGSFCSSELVVVFFLLLCCVWFWFLIL